MFRMRVSIAVAAIPLIMAASQAGAGTLDKGATELSGTAGFSSVGVPGTTRTVNTVTADMGYGFCLTRNWEILPSTSLLSISEGGSTASSISGVLSGVCNFPAAGSNIVPFVQLGAGLGTISGGGGSTSISILPRVGAGFRFLVGNAAAIKLSAMFEHDRMTDQGLSEDWNTLSFQAGISVFPVGFGGK